MRRRLFALFSFAACATTLAAPRVHADEHEIRIGTLAPKRSPWGKVFQAWQDAVSEQSKGNLKLTFYWNGNQGDDGAMVDKMRAGNQIDGAAVSALGLGKIWKDTLALQIPGLFRTYAAMDRARETLRPELEKAFDKQGFILSGLGTIGISHTMSRGFAVRNPDDLKGKRPVAWQEDVIGPVLYRLIGGVTPVPLTVPMVLPALGNESINVVTAPSLAATQLQWGSRLDHITLTAGGVTLSGLVLKKSSIEALPADLRAVLSETGKTAAVALKDRIRKADDAAFEALKKKLTNVETTADDQAKWADLIKRTMEELAKGTFDPELLKRLAAMRG